MSVQDLYNVLEVVAIDAHNQYLINAAAKAKIERETRGPY